MERSEGTTRWVQIQEHIARTHRKPEVTAQKAWTHICWLWHKRIGQLYQFYFDVWSVSLANTPVWGPAFTFLKILICPCTLLTTHFVEYTSIFSPFFTILYPTMGHLSPFLVSAHCTCVNKLVVRQDYYILFLIHNIHWYLNIIVKLDRLTILLFLLLCSGHVISSQSTESSHYKCISFCICLLAFPFILTDLALWWFWMDHGSWCYPTTLAILTMIITSHQEPTFHAPSGIKLVDIPGYLVSILNVICPEKKLASQDIAWTIYFTGMWCTVHVFISHDVSKGLSHIKCGVL